MRTVLALGLAFLIAGCASVTPVPIRAGDVCAGCRQAITETKLAAEAIDSGGVVLKFRTTTCMARFLNGKTDKMQGLFVTDYPSGRFIRAQSATFVHHVINPNTNEKDYAAFGDVREAVEFGKKQQSSPVDWLAIQRFTSAEKGN